MTTKRIDDSLEYYRTEFLRLRSVLHDRTTGFPALPVQIPSVRALLDSRRHAGVLHVEATNLDVVESLYGWQVFDRVLARVAAALEEAKETVLPPGTLLAISGVGGDRFVAFVPETEAAQEVGVDDLSRMAGEIRELLEAAFDAEEFVGLSPKLTFRTGHAFVSEDPFYRFERRVYAAVDEARTLSARRESMRERSWGAELKRIIRDAAVSTVFQPVVDLETEEILGYEALTRGPKDTVLEMPGPMFALSDRAGISVDLDRLCRTTALEAWKQVSRGGKVFLNVLPGSLVDPTWADDEPADPGDLVLEVSERALASEIEQFVETVQQLKSRGFGVALDDVGTGYATLATLEKVKPDFLKIDASVVRDMHNHLIKQELVSSLVGIADRLGASVIAEGVEVKEEAAALRTAGARYGQGFLFAGPKNADQVFAGRGRATE